MDKTLEIVQIVFIILFSVVIHEYAHGWVASKLGDQTARRLGRLTLNPLKHIDPIGTILVPLALRLLKIPFIVGWAKPVPVNFANLHNPKRDMIWVAAAGPAVNLALAVFLSQLLRVETSAFIYKSLNLMIILNLLLAIFNLIPIPPLDGSRVLMGLLPNQLARQYVKLERFGFIVLLVLLNLGLLNFIWPILENLALVLGVDPRILSS